MMRRSGKQKAVLIKEKINQQNVYITNTKMNFIDKKKETYRRPPLKKTTTTKMYGVHKLLVTFFFYSKWVTSICTTVDPYAFFFTSKKIYHTDYMEAEDRCFVKKTNTRRS